VVLFRYVVSRCSGRREMLEQRLALAHFRDGEHLVHGWGHNFVAARLSLGEPEANRFWEQ
jgi:hypothetical protein